MCKNEADANRALVDTAQADACQREALARLRKDIKAYLDHPDRYDNPSRLECWLWAAGSILGLVFILLALVNLG